MNRRRILASSLGTTLLDVNLSLDLYGTNGFRLLGLCATADRPAVLGAQQRAKTMARVKPNATPLGTTPLAYQSLLDEQRMLEALPRIADPRYRALCEVFWPHVPSAIELLRTRGADSTSPALSLRARRSDREGALAAHALAVLLHNRALAFEFDPNKSAEAAGAWTDAEAIWCQVIEQDQFWQYLKERVIAADDPRVSATHVDEIRRNLSAVLLAVHQVLALAYDREGDMLGCRRHVELVLAGPLQAAATEAIRRATLQPIVERRLDSVVQETAQLFARSDKVPRSDFKLVMERAQQGVSSVVDLVSKYDATSETSPLVNCDRLAGELLTCLDRALDYQGHERARNLVLSMVGARRMATWPLTPTSRRALEQAAEKDAKLLYGNHGLSLPGDIDPAKCWFLPGQWADADASCVYEHHRFSRVTATRIAWQAVPIVVPRSHAARSVHEGKPLPDYAMPGPLVQQLSEAEQHCRELEQQVAAGLERATAPILQSRDADLAAFCARSARQVQSDEHQLAQIEQHRLRVCAAETDDCQAALASLEAHFEAAVLPVRAEIEARESGGNRVVSFVTTAGALVGGLGVGLATAYWETFQAADNALRALLCLAELCVGIWVISIWRRRLVARRLRPLQARLSHLESEYARQWASIRDRSACNVAEINAAALEQGSGCRDRLAQVQSSLAQIADPFDSRIAEVRKGLEAPLRAKRAACERLRSQIRLKTTVRPTSHATLFPAHHNASSKGLLPGAKPSSAECDFRMQVEMTRLMDRLTQTDRMRLQVESQRMSSDEFSALLDRLSEAM